MVYKVHRHSFPSHGDPETCGEAGLLCPEGQDPCPRGRTLQRGSKEEQRGRGPESLSAFASRTWEPGNPAGALGEPEKILKRLMEVPRRTSC